MNFTWDENKRQVNLQKHGIDFEDVVEIFNGPMLTRLDTREDYGEDRWIGIGIIKQRVIVVAYTERNNGDTIRIISARKALKHEEKFYKEGVSY